MSKKIFVTRKIPDVAIKMLERRGFTVDVYPKDEILDQKKLITFLKKGEYDAVLCLLTDHIDKNVLSAISSVKIYGNYASGFDNIDVVEAKKHGVTVVNAPATATAEAVAEHTIALMFALATKSVEADNFMRRGKYKGWSPSHFVGTNLLGKTFGLVGVGRIGSKVAYYAKGLGLKIIYHDVARNDQVEKECGAVYLGSIEEVLKEADVVSLHVPLSDSTMHLINAEKLRLMKPTSFLINTSRGPVVDEKALVSALENKIIAGAGLDVFEFEPKLSSGLAKLPNVVLTPHIASASIEARNEMAEIVAQNIIDFFDGKTPNNIVNP